MRNAAAAGLAIFFGFLSLYGYLGTQLHDAPSQPLQARDILFESDVVRVTHDMTESSSTEHYRSNIHPLFVLFVNPAGALLTQAMNGRNFLAAVWLNAFFGSLGVLAAFWLFRRMSGPLSRAVLLALIFGLSMSKLIFSIIPETYSLATLSLLVTYTLFWIDLNERRVPDAVWVLAGIFSLGVTVTNFGQTLICFSLARMAFSKENPLRVVRSVFKFTALVLLASIIASFIQQWIYPTTRFFFRRASVTQEFQFVSLYIFRQPAEVLLELFRNFFVINVVGCLPHIVPGDWPLPRLTFSGSWDYPAAGLIALFGWVVLATAKFDSQHFKNHGRFYAGLGLCVLFNLAIHAFYYEKTGVIEYFIYTSHFTFPVIAILLARWLFVPGRPVTLGLALWVCLLGVNNLSIVRGIIEAYR